MGNWSIICSCVMFTFNIMTLLKSFWPKNRESVRKGNDTLLFIAFRCSNLICFYELILRFPIRARGGRLMMHPRWFEHLFSASPVKPGPESNMFFSQKNLQPFHSFVFLFTSILFGKDAECFFNFQDPRFKKMSADNEKVSQMDEPDLRLQAVSL